MGRKMGMGISLAGRASGSAAQRASWLRQRICVLLAAAACGLASAACAGNGAGAAVDILRVDASPSEPASPINLVLNVRVMKAERLIEITATVAKRAGYPSEGFFDRNVKVEVTLPPGLQLAGKNPERPGDLRGDESIEIVARIKTLKDSEGAIEVTATGEAPGGNSDADKETFHVLVKGERIAVSLGAPVQPATGSGPAPAADALPAPVE
jgi:hypothetical protein